MAILSDPISGTVAAILGHKLEGRLMDMADSVWKRAELCLEISIASGISFFGVCGLARLSVSDWGSAVASGMVAAAMAALGTYQASSRSNGLTLSFPSKIGKEQIETPMNTVTRRVP